MADLDERMDRNEAMDMRGRSAFFALSSNGNRNDSQKGVLSTLLGDEFLKCSGEDRLVWEGRREGGSSIPGFHSTRNFSTDPLPSEYCIEYSFRV